MNNPEFAIKMQDRTMGFAVQVVKFFHLFERGQAKRPLLKHSITH
jgi:hypothetical protein